MIHSIKMLVTMKLPHLMADRGAINDCHDGRFLSWAPATTNLGISCSGGRPKGAAYVQRWMFFATASKPVCPPHTKRQLNNEQHGSLNLTTQQRYQGRVHGSTAPFYGRACFTSGFLGVATFGASSLPREL